MASPNTRYPRNLAVLRSHNSHVSQRDYHQRLHMNMDASLLSAPSQGAAAVSVESANQHNPNLAMHNPAALFDQKGKGRNALAMLRTSC